MPKLNGERVRHRIAELDLPSTERLAEMSDIPCGTLRNAIAGAPMRLNRVYRLARALNLPVEEIAANNEGVPDLPPQQPKRPSAPPRRPKDRKAPKRAQAESTT